MKITIEGVQGEGKSTVARLLYEALTKHEWLGSRLVTVNELDGGYGRVGLVERPIRIQVVEAASALPPSEAPIEARLLDALDKALKTLGDHQWLKYESDCAAHDESQACCLDPDHDHYDEMLAAVAKSMAAFFQPEPGVPL